MSNGRRRLVIMPAWNEAAVIGDTVTELLATVPDVDLLVVDDGSTDTTVRAAEAAGARVLRLPYNLGVGGALRAGFKYAWENGYDQAIQVDADGQHDPAAIPLLLKAALERKTDILIASRATQFDEMAGLRSWWNRFGVWCMRKRTGFEISDSQSGFRYYSARLLRGVELRATGYELEMEILMKAWRGGFTIGSLPVAARVADGRSTSHFRPVRDTWNICMTFLKYG